MPVRVFFSYCQKDEALCQELAAQLDVLQSNGTLTTWHARKVQPGEEHRAAVDREIEAADIVLLLVSADFLASEYRQGAEVRRALERHHEGTTRVVPVVLRSCLWKEAEFGTLSPLPSGGLPITLWEDRDEAWLDVARGVRELVRSPPPTEKAQAPAAVEPRKTNERRERKAAPVVARPEVAPPLLPQLPRSSLPVPRWSERAGTRAARAVHHAARRSRLICGEIEVKPLLGFTSQSGYALSLRAR